MQMPEDSRDRVGGRPQQGHEPGTRRWIPWLIGLAALLILLYFASGVFQYDPDEGRVADGRASTGDTVK
jgi:hypothetical protein